MKISAALTAHREGHLAVASLRSMHNAVDLARTAGLSVEETYALDRPDPVTRDIVTEFASYRGCKLVEVDFGDQGKTRNSVVSGATGDYIAFLDADDLWQKEWLVRAAESASAADGLDAIWHPEFNYFFENAATIFCHLPQSSSGFSADALRLGNFWDALAFSPRKWHDLVPFPARDIDSGYAYEDWFWNAEVMLRGARHLVVEDTVIFKRRQQMSQTVRASRRRALPPPSEFWRFDTGSGL